MYSKCNNTRVTKNLLESTQLILQYPNGEKNYQGRINALGVINYLGDISCKADYWRNAFPVCSNRYSSDAVEKWQVSDPVISGIYKSTSYQHSKTHLFGHIAFELDNLHQFKETVFECYLDIFSCVERLGFSNLVRIWNYIPDIHACDNGMDRYKHFCEARHDAFEKHYPNLKAILPAATAVGITGTTFYLYFIATNQPVIYCENTRQVSAFNYPSKYGPKSPSFARASLLESVHSQLMISGTASVVGHESKHPGNILLQTQETLDNIQALVAQVNSLHDTRFNGLQSLSHLKVYVRHSNDIETIKSIIEESVKLNADIIYLEAEICRDDLLVEIEGVAVEKH